MELKNLMFGTLFSFLLLSQSFSQKKFIKEYKLNFLVDSSFTEKVYDAEDHIKKIIKYSNVALKNADANGLGIRIKYGGITDTVKIPISMDAKDILTDMLEQDYFKREVFITANYLHTSDYSILGMAKIRGSKAVVKKEVNEEFTGFILAHEFLHNLGVRHTYFEFPLRFSSLFLPEDLMSPYGVISSKVSRKTKENIWDSIDAQFYDFEPVRESD